MISHGKARPVRCWLTMSLSPLSPLAGRLTLAALLLAAMPARADMLFGNAKKAKLSIHVDAELPPDRAVVLLGTTARAETIPVGVAHSFYYYWKNGNPALELYLLPTAELPKLAEYKRWNNEREIYALLRSNTACGSPFEAERVLTGTSPAVELRYRYRLDTADGGCKAEFLALDHLDAAGALVHSDTTAPLPGLSLFGMEEPPTKSQALPGTLAQRAAATRGCGSCTTHAPHPGGLVLLAVVLLARRRRSR